MVDSPDLPIFTVFKNKVLFESFLLSLKHMAFYMWQVGKIFYLVRSTVEV